MASRRRRLARVTPRHLYVEANLLDPRRPLINGRPLPAGVTMSDWMRLHASPGFYDWLNTIHGCPRAPARWRLGGNAGNIGWCGV